MKLQCAICSALLLLFSTASLATEKNGTKTSLKRAAKPAAKTALARPAKPVAKTAVKRTFTPRGKTEVLTCRDGTEDRHARIAVVLVGGKTDSFAYYSKWKPRTCSIYLQRNRDAYSRWFDQGAVTNVNLEQGKFLIEHKPGEYRFVFRDVDRERYCGMDGTINGSLTIRKGSERCELAGIMEEGVPLGKAHTPADGNTAPPVARTPAAPAPAKQLAQRGRGAPAPWPTGGSSVSD